MKLNKLLFVAGALTTAGVVYALCRKYKMRLVAQVQDTMVKGSCKDDTPKYDFEETAEVDIGNTEIKASVQALSGEADECCDCDK